MTWLLRIIVILRIIVTNKNKSNIIRILIRIIRIRIIIRIRRL